MPIFKNKFLSNTGGSEDTTSVFNAILAQKETSLYKQGNGLSAADYDELIKMAQSFSSRLDTPSKRAGMTTKIANYELDKFKLNSNNTDIKSVQNQVEDEYRKATLGVLNNPVEFVQNRIDNLKSAYTILQDHLNGIDNSDANYATYSSALSGYEQEIKTWQSALDGYKGGRKKALQAYFKTDPSTGQPLFGEFVPAGTNPKYVTNTRTTNQTIDGIPVKLVPNLQTPGLLGANWLGKTLNTPSVSDIGAYDAATGVWMPPPPLTSQEDTGTENSVDTPASSLLPSAFIPVKDYAIGSDGKTLYQNNGDNYTKFSNTNPKDLGVSSPTPLPVVWEQRINQKVNSKVNGSQLATPQTLMPPSISPQQPASVNLQGGEPAIPPVGNPQQPSAIQQAGGQELSQQRTREITGGSLFNKILGAGKKLFS